MISGHLSAVRGGGANVLNSCLDTAPHADGGVSSGPVAYCHCDVANSSFSLDVLLQNCGQNTQPRYIKYSHIDRRASHIDLRDYKR